MSHTRNLDIAGVRLVIRSSLPVLWPDPDHAYRTFLDGDGRRIPTAIRLTLVAAPCRRLAHARKVFDGGSTWALFRDGARRYIVRKSPGGGTPLWVARIAPGLASAVVHCGRKLFGEHGGQRFIANPVRYPLDQLLLMYGLASAEGALIHAAGADVAGCGFVFPGRSEAGKSTLARILARRSDVGMLSDDRVIVRRHGRALRAWGTPWPGSEGIAANRSAPLAGVFFLRHSRCNVLRRLSPSEAFERLLPVCSIPWYEPDVADPLLIFLRRLAARVPAYDLGFVPDHRVGGLLSAVAAAGPCGSPGSASRVNSSGVVGSDAPARRRRRTTRRSAVPSG